jgi:hypothetical protein
VDFGYDSCVTDSTRIALVRELAEHIVVAVAPDEREVFPTFADAYAADPKVIRPGRGRDDPLGFGVGDVGHLLTPAALFVASAVVWMMPSTGWWQRRSTLESCG